MKPIIQNNNIIILYRQYCYAEKKSTLLNWLSEGNCKRQGILLCKYGSGTKQLGLKDVFPVKQSR